MLREKCEKFAPRLAMVFALAGVASGCGTAPEATDETVSQIESPIVWPNDFVYDWGTQCAIPGNLGGGSLHCCPPGHAMVGANLDYNVFKCARLTGARDNRENVWMQPGFLTRNGTHSCNPGHVMAGYHRDRDILLCHDLAPLVFELGDVFAETLDGVTQDPNFYMHICGALGSAMSGINSATNVFNCVNEKGDILGSAQFEPLHASM